MTVTAEGLPRPLLLCKACADQPDLSEVLYLERRDRPEDNLLHVRCREHKGALLSLGEKLQARGPGDG